MGSFFPDTGGRWADVNRNIFEKPFDISAFGTTAQEALLAGDSGQKAWEKLAANARDNFGVFLDQKDAQSLMLGGRVKGISPTSLSEVDIGSFPPPVVTSSDALSAGATSGSDGTDTPPAIFDAPRSVGSNTAANTVGEPNLLSAWQEGARNLWDPIRYGYAPSNTLAHLAYGGGGVEPSDIAQGLINVLGIPGYESDINDTLLGGVDQDNLYDWFHRVFIPALRGEASSIHGSTDAAGKFSTTIPGSGVVGESNIFDALSTGFGELPPSLTLGDLSVPQIDQSPLNSIWERMQDIETWQPTNVEDIMGGLRSSTGDVYRNLYGADGSPGISGFELTDALRSVMEGGSLQKGASDLKDLLTFAGDWEQPASIGEARRDAGLLQDQLNAFPSLARGTFGGERGVSNLIQQEIENVGDLSSRLGGLTVPDLDLSPIADDVTAMEGSLPGVIDNLKLLLREGASGKDILSAISDIMGGRMPTAQELQTIVTALTPELQPYQVTASDLTMPDARAMGELIAGTLPDISVEDLGLPGVDVEDLGLPGVSVGDLSLPNVGVGDLGLPSVGVSDLGLPGVSVSDLGLPSVSVSDLGLPGVGISDLGLPEVGVSDLGLPGVNISDLGLPGVSVGDLGLPGVSVSDLGLPGVSVSDLGLPGVSVSDLGLPGVSVGDLGLPGVNISDLGLPGVSLGDLGLPNVTATDMRRLGVLPSLSASDLGLPNVGVGDLGLPDISVSDLGLPGVRVRDLGLPGIGLSDLGLPEVSVADLGLPNVGVSDVGLPELTVEDVLRSGLLPSLAVGDLGLPSVGVSDLSLPEVGLTDLGLPEVGLSDLGLPEVGLSDLGLPGVSISDLGLPGVSLTDLGLPEVGVSDLGLPGVGLSDLGLPSVGLSDLGLPEVGVSDLGLPSVGVSDLGLPGVSVSDLGLPSVGVSDLGLPGVNVSDLGLPSVGVSDLGLPGVNISDLGLPSVGVSDLGLPGVGISDLGLPSVGLSDLGLPGIGLSDLGLPSVGVSDLGLPGIGLSDLGLPGIGISDLGLPGVGVSDLGLPEVGLSDLGLPGIGLSDLGLPGVDLSDLGLPSVGLSDLGLPEVGLSDLGLPGIGLSDLGLPEVGVSDLGLPKLQKKDLGLPEITPSDLGLPELGVSDLGLPSIGASDVVDLSGVTDLTDLGMPSDIWNQFSGVGDLADFVGSMDQNFFGNLQSYLDSGWMDPERAGKVVADAAGGGLSIEDVRNLLEEESWWGDPEYADDNEFISSEYPMGTKMWLQKLQEQIGQSFDKEDPSAEELRADPITKSILEDLQDKGAREESQLREDLNRLGLLSTGLEDTGRALGTLRSGYGRAESAALSDAAKRKQDLYTKAMDRGTTLADIMSKRDIGLGELGGYMPDGTTPTMDREEFNLDKLAAAVAALSKDLKLDADPNELQQSLVEMILANSNFPPEAMDKFWEIMNEEEAEGKSWAEKFGDAYRRTRDWIADAFTSPFKDDE